MEKDCKGFSGEKVIELAKEYEEDKFGKTLSKLMDYVIMCTPPDEFSDGEIVDILYGICSAVENDNVVGYLSEYFEVKGVSNE